MNLKAISDRILIKKDPVEKQTFGDQGQFMLINEDGDYAAYYATVVDVGPGRYLEVDGKMVFEAPTVKAGDRIMVTGGAVGHPLPQRLKDEVGPDYAFIFEAEILAQIADEEYFVLTATQIEELVLERCQKTPVTESLDELA